MALVDGLGKYQLFGFMFASLSVDVTFPRPLHTLPSFTKLLAPEQGDGNLVKGFPGC